MRHQPGVIERESFSIIRRELEERNLHLDPKTEDIVMRCIHTSADFDYADILAVSPGADDAAIKALQNGAHIVTDTTMAMSGINKRMLAQYGGDVHCFISDEDVIREASERGTTRAVVSMEHAAKLEQQLIFAIGNAPTALMRLCELIDAGEVRPALVIGVPVGFVNVVKSKEMLMERDVPYIVSRGNKGGSNIAACICNALLYR
ncbi:MAG: precorrin-8X methylmutase [Eubacterium sp.]|nr:precorrin-8X methylmutase [Eubacterium sp.]